MDIVSKANNLKRALKKDVTFYQVKCHIESKGYSVVFLGTPQGDEIVKRYNLEAHKDKKAFTYVNDVIKVIFMRSDISEYQKLQCLLHEVGHIELGHLDVSSLDIDDENAEMQAEAFTYEVLYGKRSAVVPVVISVTLALLFISVLINCHLYGKFNTSYAPDKSEKTSVINTVQETQADYYVYITPTGSKYHTADCSYLRGNGIKVKLSEIEDKYTPCSVCNPNK